MPLPSPSPTMAVVFLLLALHLCAVFTGLGAFAFAWLCEFLAGVRKQMFLKKLAQQMSALGIMFLAYILTATGGSMAVMYARYPEFIRTWLDAPLLAVVPGAAILWLTLFGLVYALSWRGSKSNPGLHRTIGLLAAMGLPLVLAASLAVKLVAFGGLELPQDGTTLVTALAIGLQSPFFASLFTGAVFQALTCAAGFGLVYLLIRRNRDDFGRDYYGFTVAHTALWAVLFALPTAAAQAWAFTLATTLAPTSPNLELMVWLDYTGFGALLLATVLWIMIRRSKNPLRMKPAILLAALALLVSMAAFAAFNAGTFFALT